MDATTEIWVAYQTIHNWQDLVVQQGVEYLVRDSFKNLEKVGARGITARSATTKTPLWHTPFPLESVASQDIAMRQIDSSSVILRGNRLFCSYLVTPDAMAPKIRFWEFVILDTASGMVVRRERSKVAEPQIKFTIVGDNWFVTDELAKQTIRLEPATGEPIWTYPDVLQFSTVTDKTVSSYRRTERTGSDWEVTSLDLATGKPFFSHRFNGLNKHIIKGVLVRDGKAFIEFGAQYTWDLEQGTKYRTYTVAFDAVTGKPIWRTPFFD